MEAILIYYNKVVKRIEKKYTLMCTLYNITKLSYFKKKKYIYNKLLIYCYKLLKDNKLF